MHINGLGTYFIWLPYVPHLVFVKPFISKVSVHPAGRAVPVMIIGVLESHGRLLAAYDGCRLCLERGRA